MAKSAGTGSHHALHNAESMQQNHKHSLFVWDPLHCPEGLWVTDVASQGLHQRVFDICRGRQHDDKTVRVSTDLSTHFSVVSEHCGGCDGGKEECASVYVLPVPTIRGSAKCLVRIAAS